MHGSLLAVLELGNKDRVHRAADDGGFDHGAGIQADRRRCVIHRVKILVLRTGVVRHGADRRPAGDIVESGKINRPPFTAPAEMRTDQDPALAQHGMGALAEMADPALHEWRFGRAAFQESRAEVQDDRPVRAQADARAELFARC